VKEFITNNSENNDMCPSKQKLHVLMKCEYSIKITKTMKMQQRNPTKKRSVCIPLAGEVHTI
jgi:hypothetical protein